MSQSQRWRLVQRCKVTISDNKQLFFNVYIGAAAVLSDHSLLANCLAHNYQEGMPRPHLPRFLLSAATSHRGECVSSENKWRYVDAVAQNGNLVDVGKLILVDLLRRRFAAVAAPMAVDETKIKSPRHTGILI